MHPDAEAVGGVEFADGRLTALAALRIEIRDQVCEARAVEPRATAELALAIGAAAGGDDERGLARACHHSPLFPWCCACRSNVQIGSSSCRARECESV